MRQTRRIRTVLTALLAVMLACSYVAEAATPSDKAGGARGMEVVGVSGNRYAVLVGVDEYDRYRDLKYCKADMEALRESLSRIGFERGNIAVLTDGRGEEYRPVKQNILDRLEAILDKVTEKDLVVVALSGHGTLANGKSYFCPADADRCRPEETLIPIEEFYERLKECPGGLKMVFVDACRNECRTGAARGPVKGPQGPAADFAKGLQNVVLPRGTILLASCTTGERSWEDDGLKRGVFMHFLTEGLRGKAGADADGDRWVSFFELRDYVCAKTKRRVRKTKESDQNPYYHTSIDLPDFKLAPVPKYEPPMFTAWPFDVQEAERRQEVTADALDQGVDFVGELGMKFRLIPAGEFMMGSPDGEKGRDSDEGPVRPVRIEKPFYLGMHEVTVGQFKVYKAGRGDGGEPCGAVPKWQFRQEDDHPVVCVSWDDAVAFCDWLSRREGRRYRLPTEAEWEYACRAGTETPFHFGKSLNGTKANCDGRYPYGTQVTGPSLDKTASVGYSSPNAWGLRDMHGNVWEWCSDAIGPNRVIRGGSWSDRAEWCRSADRIDKQKATCRRSTVGFRVVLEPEGKGRSAAD